jgi:putative transposase
MTRPLRIEYPDAVYHVTSRGNARFMENKTGMIFCLFFPQLLNYITVYGMAYCLMDNHYHLLIETPDGNLSQGMRQINGTYTTI